MRRRIEFTDEDFIVNPVEAYAGYPIEYATLPVCDNDAAVATFRASLSQPVPLSVEEVVTLAKAYQKDLDDRERGEALLADLDNSQPIEIIQENDNRTPISTPYGVHKNERGSSLNQSTLPIVTGLKARTRAMRTHVR